MPLSFHFQYIPDIWYRFATSLVTVMLALYALRHNKVRGAVAFSICMFLTSLWAASNALEISGVDLPTKIFWANLQYLSYVFSPVVWLLMVFRFIDRDHWIYRSRIIMLMVIPVITLLLVWTNDMHGLIRQNVTLDLNGEFSVIDKTYGPWFWIITVYSDLLNVLSLVLLGLSLTRKSSLYREQSKALLVGLLLLIVPHLLYVMGVEPFARYDMTPVIAGISGLIIAWGIFRFRLFDIVPVARETVIEIMADGFIVVDRDNRIIDLNVTARNILALPFPQILGQEATTVLAGWPELLNVISGLEEKKCEELQVFKTGCSRIYDVNCIPLNDRRGINSGRSIVLHDVTEPKMAQMRLLEQQKTMAIIQERERMARELHDSLGQVLGYINIQAQAVQEQIRTGQTELAADCLRRLSQVAQDTHNDVREYIQSIRGMASNGKDFIENLRNYLEHYQRNYGIAVNLVIANEAAVSGIEDTSGRQLLRVIQEALANVRKHAGTDMVKISFADIPGYIRIVVEDYGCGFSLDQKSYTYCYGLGIMAERVHELGGTIDINSQPGQGTKIYIHCPLSNK